MRNSKWQMLITSRTIIQHKSMQEILWTLKDRNAIPSTDNIQTIMAKMAHGQLGQIAKERDLFPAGLPCVASDWWWRLDRSRGSRLTRRRRGWVVRGAWAWFVDEVNGWEKTTRQKLYKGEENEKPPCSDGWTKNLCTLTFESNLY